MAGPGGHSVDLPPEIAAAALEALTHGVVVSSAGAPDGRVIYANAGFTRLTGLSREEVLGRLAFFARGLCADGPRDAAIEAAMGLGRTFQGEVSSRRRDGAALSCELTLAPLRDAAGGITHWVGALVDATARRATETATAVKAEADPGAIRRPEKMDAIGRLAAGVAHDFNNILTVINSCAELLRREEARPETAERRRWLHDEIASAGKRAGALTRQLLTLSRRQLREPAVIDLGRTVLGLEATLRRLTGEGIELAVRADLRAGLVRADAGQIEQAVVSLVVNARDAMPQGGRIEVSVRRVDVDASRPAPTGAAQLAASPGAYIELLVADTGPALDGEQIAHAFEPFYAARGEGQDTGLALATVHAIVRQSGGAIDVESAPGRGAAFRILLPRLEEVAAPDTPRP